MLLVSYKLVITLGVNFINVLGAAYTGVDPKSAKMSANSSVFFALLGYARVKAARRTLMKLTLGPPFLSFVTFGDIVPYPPPPV